MKRIGIALGCVALLGLSGWTAERREPAVTLHVILQSHLDPVWLWNREQGVDAAIATARTMSGEGVPMDGKC